VPLLGPAGNETHTITMATDLRRCVVVERVTSMNAAVEAITIAAAAGAAVAWIRNTVDDAIEAAELLRARGLNPLLFHARFAMGDRLTVEQEVLRLFGPYSTASERTGRVLVATQVVEQSLDLDFDLLVSDLAPADLIIQRAGRLWRHPWRGARPVPGPRLLLLSPEPVADPPTDWLGDARTRYVYDNPAILWRSARALLSAGRIISPDGRGRLRRNEHACTTRAGHLSRGR
jgi:CRISPR-associated endonuclease/helicase Cas3